MIYFTSDLHFYHVNILKYNPDERPFDNVLDMNEHIVDYWNKLVKPNDEVYILGDVGVGRSTKLINLVKTLNGRLHLIRGNHDHFKKPEEEELFETVRDYRVVHHNKKKIVCFHFPIEEWDGCYKGHLHLHGHCHGNLERKLPNRFDIGWDVHKRLIPIDEVLSWEVDERVPHHGCTDPVEEKPIDINSPLVRCSQCNLLWPENSDQAISIHNHGKCTS
tara:strand:- start:1979 stop:2635 length:657 start_codon:yes stop_codon:yes gene_type:complete